MNPVEAARVTAALSHVGGILETLPLDDFLDHIREQRDALPNGWDKDALDPLNSAMRRRFQALIAAATKAGEVAEEVRTASAFWQQARAIQREDPPPYRADDGPTVAQPGGQVLRPKFGRLTNTTSCDCPMGECSHPAGLDGPA